MGKISFFSKCCWGKLDIHMQMDKVKPYFTQHTKKSTRNGSKTPNIRTKLTKLGKKLHNIEFKV